MGILIYLGCFVLGFALGFAAGLLIREKRQKQDEELPLFEAGEQPPEYVLKQWENFLNYSGSERGQTKIED